MPPLSGLADPLDVLDECRLILLPPPKLTVSKWADSYRILSREDSAAPGQWSTDSRPYQRGIMDALSDPRIERVTVQGGAQWGKTQILGNIVGYFIHLDPCPVMVVQPTIQMAEKWSKTRLAPMIRDTPVLHDLVADAKSRDSGNTILEKTFPGGLLVIVGSNAPAGLASQPIRVLCLDEVDRFEESAGSEGDPVDLAETRTVDFEGRRKIYACSTPGIQGYSRIEKSMAESDQRYFHLPCAHCGTFQALKWDHVVWPKGQPELAIYACEACGGELTDAHLKRAQREGKWIATRPDIKGHAGFFLSGLYVRKLGSLAQDLTKAKAKGVKSLQVFINTRLGELWDPRDGEEIQAKGLLVRREPYAARVPMGVGLLTAGIDVQGDRLEVKVKGWGIGEESWLIDYQVFAGNLALLDPWDRLETYLRSTFLHESGAQLQIRAAALDHGGHYSKQVMKFIRRASLKGRVFAVKGASGRQSQTVLRSKKGRHWMIDTISLKDTIFARLRVKDPGPSFMHFPEADFCDQVYFEGLTSEKVVPKRINGVDARRYEKVTPAARNEPLDTEVYASAALEIYNPRDLSVYVARLQQTSAETVEKAPEEGQNEATNQPPEQAQKAAKKPLRPASRIPWALKYRK